MAGLIKDADMLQFYLNTEVPHYMVEKLLEVPADEYNSLTPAEAQGLRVEKAIDFCSKAQSLPYFLK